MAAENSRSSSSAADSYVGSLISLTSKSEIRYEGILYNIDTEESSIGLRNVRSFGTEGRKKDGLQVMPSDKVYEYILFRGSDIKDLQVKSSPPVQPPIQTTLPINNDPAIIQSHYPRPSATSSSLLPTGTGSTDIGTHTTQLGQPGSTYQSGMPLYQPGGNLGSWGPSPPPPPSANGNGLAMPMYWPGYYAPQNGLPQLHQQSLLRPPPGLSIPPSMQQQVQYPAFNTSLPTGPSNLPEYPMPLLPTTTTSSPNLTSTTTLPSSLPPVPPVTLSLEAFPSFMQNKLSNSVIPNAALNSTSLPLLSPFTTSSPDGNAIVPPISTKPIATPTLPYQANPQPISQPISSVVGISSSKLPETATPSLVTPGQLLHSGQTTVSSSQTTSQTARKDVEVVQVSPPTTSEPPAPITTEAESPILPLPLPSRTVQKPNGAPYQTHQDNNYRGHARGRGTGIYRPVMKFTEEFDFTAMNEKFKKDEVWGHLGKSNKSNLKGDGNASEEDHYEEEDDAELLKFDVKPVYSKDDFFDTFSCNALDNQSNNGRTRFSEQMKLDTETFGEFSRYRGGWGGRGLGRGGRGPGQGGPSRGGYYGRGYGYAGRGRVRSMPSRDY